MKHQIHQCQPSWAFHMILAEVRFVLDAFRHVAVQSSALRLVDQPFISGDEETARTAGRITHVEISMGARIGLHAPHDGLNEYTRSEILSRAFLAFVRSLL